MSNLFWLTDAQMARLEPFFPKSHGKPRVDDPLPGNGLPANRGRDSLDLAATQENSPPDCFLIFGYYWGKRAAAAPSARPSARKGCSSFSLHPEAEPCRKSKFNGS